MCGEGQSSNFRKFEGRVHTTGVRVELLQTEKNDQSRTNEGKKEKGRIRVFLSWIRVSIERRQVFQISSILSTSCSLLKVRPINLQNVHFRFSFEELH